jgi:hypothetical protein
MVEFPNPGLLLRPGLNVTALGEDAVATVREGSRLARRGAPRPVTIGHAS